MISLEEAQGVYNLDTQPVNAGSERSASDLPAELWYLVASNLQPRDIEKLLGLNRVFFDIVMDRRYNELNLANPYRLMERMSELIDSQLIVGRVRSLRLDPGEIWKAIDGDLALPLNPSRKTHRKTRSLVAKFKAFIAPSTTSSVEPIPTGPTTLLRDESAIEKRHEIVRLVATALVSVKKIHITWRPKDDPDNLRWQYPVCPLLEILLPTFGKSLRSLSLTVPLSVAYTYLPSAHDLKNLRVEELSLIYDEDQRRMDAGSGMIALLPLLKASSATIKTLALAANRETGNLSPFFNGIDRMPLLRKLTLLMPLSPALVPSTTGINRLLRHPLEHLHISLRYYCTITRPFSFTPLSGWFDDCVNGVNFHSLKSLQIGLSPSVSPHLRVAFSVLYPPCQWLTSLSIPDICLSESDFQTMLDAFNSHLLTYLAVYLQVLSVEIIDVLALKCPLLDELQLDVDRLITDLSAGTVCYEYHVPFFVTLCVSSFDEVDIHTTSVFKLNPFFAFEIGALDTTRMKLRMICIGDSDIDAERQPLTFFPNVDMEQSLSCLLCSTLLLFLLFLPTLPTITLYFVAPDQVWAPRIAITTTSIMTLIFGILGPLVPDIGKSQALLAAGQAFSCRSLALSSWPENSPSSSTPLGWTAALEMEHMATTRIDALRLHGSTASGPSFICTEH
ncbi:hypothetical protein H0H93_016244 [Arthromyces matolae]|nr:hypothetical protein H0H93_016244 [Arthromyces matolae]